MEFTQEAIQRVLLTFPIFLFSLSVHEAAHAITAKWGGDLTSAYQGRITLNPISHIDPIGTILMPIFGGLAGIPLIGWARPVPFVATNFKRGEAYSTVVAFAGPFSNLLIALFTIVIAQVFFLTYYETGFGAYVTAEVAEIIRQLFVYMVAINLFLMLFNLLPIPPLDGSHLFWHWVAKDRPAIRDVYESLYPYGFFILLGLLWTGIIPAIAETFAFPVIRRFIGFFYFPLEIIDNE